jgi:hypothetical protein
LFVIRIRVAAFLAITLRLLRLYGEFFRARFPSGDPRTDFTGWLYQFLGDSAYGKETLLACR